jgi:hypothetical protein
MLKYGQIQDKNNILLNYYSEFLNLMKGIGNYNVMLQLNLNMLNGF